jgi:hypothetical protein
MVCGGALHRFHILERTALAAEMKIINRSESARASSYSVLRDNLSLGQGRL